MAKIGTAHLEIKPVVDEATLTAITERIAAAVAEGVARGMRQAAPGPTFVSGGIFNGLCTCPAQTGPHPFHPATKPTA